MKCLKLPFTCMPRCPGLPAELPPKVRVPWRYRLSRCSSDRYLLCTGAPLRSALDRWRLGDGARRRSFNVADVLLSCLFQVGFVESILPLQTSLPWLFPLVALFRCSSTGGTFHTGTSSRCSRPVPRPVVLSRTSTPLLVLLTGPKLSLLPDR